MALSRESGYPVGWLDWGASGYCDDEEWENHTPIKGGLVPLYMYNVEEASEYFCKDCLQLRLGLVHPILNCNNCGSHRIIRGKVGELDKATLKQEYQNYKKEMKNMSRIVKVDFTGVETGGARNVVVPEGDYALEITKITGKKGKESGKPNLIITFKLSQGPKKGNGKELQHNCSLQQQSLWNFRNILEAVGKTVPSKAVKIDVDKLVGMKCAGSVVDGEYNDRKRSEIANFFPLKELSEASEGEEIDEEVEEAEEKPKKKNKKGKAKQDEMFSEETEETEESEEKEETEEEEDDLFS